MPEQKRPFFYSLISIFFLVLFIIALVQSFRVLDYNWDFSILKPFVWQSETHQPGILLQGLWGTLWISSVSILFGTLLGLFIGTLLIIKEPVSHMAAVCYVDLFRNTPVLVQLYVMYFVVGTALNLSPEKSGVFTLSLFCSAYVAEIYRGTLVNFDRGQLDAAHSMGLGRWAVAKDVVLPQVLRRMLPPLVGQFVSLVKDSSLVSVISIMELTKAALNVVSVTFRSFETWFFIAFLYLCLNLVLSTIGRSLEKRLSVSLR